MNTSFLSGIHWVAVLVAGLGYFALGSLWYSKILFAKKWLQYAGINPKAEDAMKGIGAIMAGSLLLMILTSVGLAVLAVKLQMVGWCNGLKLGLLTGVCVGSSAISVSYLYEKRPLGLHLINAGYTIAGNIIAAIIICIWR